MCTYTYSFEINLIWILFSKYVHSYLLYSEWYGEGGGKLIGEFKFDWPTEGRAPGTWGLANIAVWIPTKQLISIT